MGLSAININNIDTNLKPTRVVAGTLVADQTLTVTDSVASMLATPLNDLTTHVMWTLDGAGARFTLDGTDPTSTVGHIVYDGRSGIWHRATAESAKWIRTSGVSANLHITEMVY